MVLFSFLEVRETSPLRGQECLGPDSSMPDQYWDSQGDLFPGKNGRLLLLNYLYYLYGLEVAAFIMSWTPNPRKYEELTCCQKFYRIMIVFFFVGLAFAVQWETWYIVYNSGYSNRSIFHISGYFAFEVTIPI
jgi:hypothetical protein